MVALYSNWKSYYPFRLGTTSFIIPDDYLPNVQYLGPHFDNIELLFLESGPERLPSVEMVQELKALSKTLDITYSIHLPIDLDLGDADFSKRESAVDGLKLLIKRIALLEPVVQVLHLNPPEEISPSAWRGWQERCAESLSTLGAFRTRLAVENLFYPFDRVEPLIVEFGLSVCMDVGHLVRQDLSLFEFYKIHEKRISTIHLQGADSTGEHLALDHLSPEHLKPVQQILHRFGGLVTLEVFDTRSLERSLQVLQNLMDRDACIWG